MPLPASPHDALPDAPSDALPDVLRSFPHDVVVIGGCGHVGLPLAVLLADQGASVVVYDVSEDAAKLVNAGVLPFDEPGAAPVLERVVADGRLQATTDPAAVGSAENVVVVIGTPVDKHLNPDPQAIPRALWATAPHLRDGQLLVLRSTVAPGTTDFVAGYLEKHRGFRVGEDLFVAHVPERIAADRFMEEIGTLPCIVGGVGERSGERAERLFAVLGAPVVQTSPVQAELAKIWANILRYATFALPNLLMMDCERHGANVFQVIDLINRDYPRGGIALPGLTAGTCLRKDFGMVSEFNAYPDLFLSAWKINEHMLVYLVDKADQEVYLHIVVVAVIVMTY